MSAAEKIAAGRKLPRIRSVASRSAFEVEVAWTEATRGGATEVVDLAPLVFRLKFYAPLWDDEALRRSVHLIEGGAAIAWGASDAVDMAAGSVLRLAEQGYAASSPVGDGRDSPRSGGRLAADPAGVAAAADLLRRGGLVAFPTETVYGLGADANSAAAVAAVYAAKGRPRFNPLIAHVADLDAALDQGTFGSDALLLARAFWPGPLTLVVPAAPGCAVSDLARAGLGSVALRVPAHPVARALIAAAGVPVAAPSANRSGRISPTTAAHALGDLDGRIDAVLDGGATAVGVESTVVSCLGAPALLRPGGVTRAAIEAVLGCRLAAPKAGGPTVAPGMLTSHYAPRAAVRLGAEALRPGEAGLDFGGRFAGQGGANGAPVLDLSPRRDLAEAAANLFGHLRRLDEALAGAGAIAVAPIPADGLGEAIADRLARAAAGR